jgi:hypothetical protein
MSGGDAILLHAMHAGRGFDGWLLLLPPAPAAALGLMRLAIRLWPAIHRRFHSPAEPV